MEMAILLLLVWVGLLARSHDRSVLDRFLLGLLEGLLLFLLLPKLVPPMEPTLVLNLDLDSATLPFATLPLLS